MNTREQDDTINGVGRGAGKQAGWLIDRQAGRVDGSDGLDGLAIGQMPEGPRLLVGRPITGWHACRVCTAASTQRGPTLSLGPLSRMLNSFKLANCL